MLIDVDEHGMVHLDPCAVALCEVKPGRHADGSPCTWLDIHLMSGRDILLVFGTREAAEAKRAQILRVANEG